MNYNDCPIFTDTMSALSHLRVLIVDDNEEMVQLMAWMLRQKNIDVQTAADGMSGLEIIKETNPDVIITDLMMPNMNGFALMEKAQEHNPLTPVIVVTAYGSMKSAIRALRLGAFDFLTKPFNKDDVQNTVAKAAEQVVAQKYENWRQRINEALSISRVPAEIGHKLIALTTAALKADYGLLWKVDTASPLLLLPTKDEALAKKFVAWAQETGLGNSGDDSPSSLLFSPPAGQSGAEFKGSLVGIKLITHKIIQGVLILAQPQENYFDEADVAFLENIAPFAALALDNAKTYARLEASHDKLASLQRISTLTYNANIPLNRMLRLIAEGIRQNLHYPGIMICLPEQNNRQLVVRTAGGDLDRFLHRRGDTPTRRIVIPLDDVDNPICRAFRTRNIQEASVSAWTAVLEAAGATDMAEAVTKLNLSRYLFLPLWQSEEVIGVLVLGTLNETSLSDDEWNLLGSVANQTALIIKNTSLYNTELQGRREMEALYQAGLVITSSLSQGDVLRTIIEQIVELTLFESCIIGRWDERHEAEVIELYVQKTEAGWIEKEPPGTVYSLKHRPLVVEALAQRKMKVIRLNDPMLSPDEQAWMDETEARLRLIIPLIVRSNSIGVLELITTQPNQHFTEHISRITQGLAAQAAIALENARLYESETKRLEHELDLAHRIQVSLLPHETPQIPGMTIAARSVSARMVGGDFYRYISLPDGQFGVVVGDVSGKGVPSALYMAMTITAMDTQIRQQTSSSDMLQQLNGMLYPRMHANRMNTALLIALFNPHQSSLQVANAGMIAPLIRQKQDFNWMDVSGLPIGATPGAVYTGQTISLANHSTIILASDGIIEATDQKGEMFGFERFQESAQQLSNISSSQQILEAIWDDVIRHIGDIEPHDDMTLVVIQTWGRRGGTKVLGSLPDQSSDQ